MVCAAATVDALKLVADTDERLGVQHEERRAGELSISCPISTCHR